VIWLQPEPKWTHHQWSRKQNVGQRIEGLASKQRYTFEMTATAKTTTLETLTELLLPPVNSTSTTNINGHIYLDTNLNLLVVNILITANFILYNKHNKTHQHSQEFFFILRYTNEHIIIIIVMITIIR